MDKKEEYLVLLSKTYDKVVEILLKKYGSATDDYFREASYNRFLNNEIKRITRGNYSRTSDGLYCHHIDEINHENLSSEKYIKDFRYPFKLQKKDRLVYCDLLEHAILHVLIAKETFFEFGSPGYSVYIAPMIKEWYLDERSPNPKWMKNCYDKAYMKPKEASELLEKMDNILSTVKEEIHQGEQEKIKEIIKKGNFKNLNNDNSRSEIVRAMYDLNKVGADGYTHIFNDFVYSEKYERNIRESVEFEEFERRMEPYDLGGIIKNIQLYIKYIEVGMSHGEYFSQIEIFSKTKKEAKAELRAQEKKEKLEKLKREEFYSQYPKFEKIGISYDVKRQDVNALLFKPSNKYPSFIKFQSAMKRYNINELLEILHSVMKE